MDGYRILPQNDFQGRDSSLPPDTLLREKMKSWDYVIVGAGSAGCVLARRLSDDPSVRVLLLESGPPPDDFWIRTPAGMAKMFLSDRYNWRYSTEPVPGLRGRRIYWPRGKTLGGSSAINGMVYTRGNRRDYDHWSSLGNPGWNWDEVLPYFKRSENNTRGANPVRGAGGPLTVSDPAVRHPTVLDFIEAARRNGIPVIDDLSCAGEEGVGELQATIHNGVRQSCYDAYIAPVLHRTNLTVMTDAHVLRVVLNDRQATGVEIEHHGQRYIVSAQREVVLSAGAIGSPHLLMLSGIGNGDLLQRHGLETVRHLPGVGENLQDHCSVHFKSVVGRESSYNLDLTGWRQYAQGVRYVLTKGGYLALGSSLAAAFVRSGPDVNYADLEISFRPMTFTFDDLGRAKVDREHAISAAVYPVRPVSRGRIVLQSKDPAQAPAFHPNYLQAEEDRRAMIAGLRFARTLLSSHPLASRVHSEMSPGVEMESDAHLMSYIEQQAKCAYHPVGTCKMGQDEMAVVDHRLRVHGLDRLRVVDASIMPNIISGNTNAPTIMIGEKGADMILADARN
ncbi:GMC family oxidoreductase [Aquabacterium sp.]|uniref:GMC family oxidoreductase n=1 Tax=Aquabacterium sp. TaxID=1872578 RepID=UPI003BAF9504